jgi:hypothetical protein
MGPSHIRKSGRYKFMPRVVQTNNPSVRAIECIYMLVTYAYISLWIHRCMHTYSYTTAESRKSRARQRFGKQVPAELNTHATIEVAVSKKRIGKRTTIEVFLETVFSVGAAPSLYNENFKQLRDNVFIDIQTYRRGNNERREKKTKVLKLNKYMAMGPSGARCQE